MKHNRWFVVFGALLIQVSLGAIYIYSVFKPALKEHFPAWSATDIALPAQILLALSALSMVAAGKIQDRIGPKKTSIIGAFILLLGMYVAAKAQTLAQFVFGFGVMGGIGIYTAYVCPIATCVKWFPDKRGLITGLAVAGFGAGGLVFAPLASYFIAHIGIMAALFYLGLVYFFAIIIGAQLMRVPPAGYCPAGWMAPAVGNNQKIDFTTKEMIQTRRFWILWLTYFIGCTAGLLVIMNLVNIWQSQAAAGFAKIAGIITGAQFSQILAQGILAVMSVSILNSLGRIVWGLISDKIGRERTLMTIFALCGIMLLILNGLNSFWSFVSVVAIIGFCFGGFLALYPAITADYFGSKNIGANYGLMFSAYGAGGLLGPWLAPKLMALGQIIPYETAGTAGKTIVKLFEIGDYSTSFIFAGLMCIAAALLVSRLKTKSL
ncbi:MAG: OFA family MFS transporter [Candidatus Paceibacterota bacterium]